MCTDACASSRVSQVTENNGDSLHQRQIGDLGAAPEQTQDRGERQRLRPALLRGGAVLPESGVLGHRAPEPPGRAGAAGRGQPAGRAGAKGEEREEGDQGAQHPALHQGEIHQSALIGSSGEGSSKPSLVSSEVLILGLFLFVKV